MGAIEKVEVERSVHWLQVYLSCQKVFYLKCERMDFGSEKKSGNFFRGSQQNARNIFHELIKTASGTNVLV